ncbi:MAG: hypothetical protein AB7I41_04915 [Candidatus Sericytochromatia bacterium]
MPITGPTPPSLPPSSQSLPVTAKPVQTPVSPTALPHTAKPATPTANPSKFLQKTVASKNIQKLRQMSSPVQQQNITQSIWKKGAVQTGAQPKLNLLVKHADPAKKHIAERPELENDALEAHERPSEKSETQENSQKESLDERGTAPEPEAHNLESTPEKLEQERPREQEKDREGGRGQQQSRQQRSPESDSEEAETEASETVSSYLDPNAPIPENSGSDMGYLNASANDPPVSAPPVTSLPPGAVPPVANPQVKWPKATPELAETLTTKSVEARFQQQEPKVSGGMGVQPAMEDFFEYRGGQETLFFKSEVAQVLNRVTFEHGRANTTLQKKYEALGDRVQKLEKQLADPAVRANPELRQGVQKELAACLKERDSFHTTFAPLHRAWKNHQSLLARQASPVEIAEAEMALKSAESLTMPRLEALMSNLEALSTNANPGAFGTAIKIGAKEFNRMIFVMSPRGEIYAMDQSKRDLHLPDGHTLISQAKIHHSSMLNGQEVSAAGELRIGSQLSDLQQEYIRTGSGREAADTQLDIEKFNQQVNKNAIASVERRFIETFKTNILTKINADIHNLESKPVLTVQQQHQLGELKQQRSELINEAFLSPSATSALSGLFKAEKNTHFEDFKKQILPQVLHNLLEAQFPKGKVEILSDQSGHYLPDMGLTTQSILVLEKKGVSISDITVSLGRKSALEKELRVPATAVASFYTLGQSEELLRRYDAQKQSLHLELFNTFKPPAPVVSAPLSIAIPPSEPSPEPPSEPLVYHN